MAKWKIRAKRVYREWRANFIVWAIQWIGGSALIISIWHAILQEYRRDPVDWMFFGIIFGIGVLLILFSFWKRSEKEPQYSKEELDGKLAEQRDELEKKIPVIMVNGKRLGEPSSTQSTAVPAASALGDLFTPLQIEAFQLAKELREFYAGLGPRPTINKDMQDGTAEGNARAITDLHRREKPIIDQVQYDYPLRFKERVSRMRLLFGKNGLSSQVFEDVEHMGVQYDITIQRLAREMECMAIQLNYPSS